jgi:RNA polymerase sigma-70 factor (ECF subfamily)
VNDDAQLIDQTLGGQSAAFGQLVEKYQDRLYNTLVHVLGNAEDAKDVVQEAFVRAFLKLATFERASAFYTWLYRIALNLAATHQRQRRTARAAEQARVVDGEPARAGDGPSGRLERDECRGQVRRAVAALEEEFRAVVVLREIDGCCYETIAEILDLPIGTVRSRLHRARMQLREQLKTVLAVGE